MDWQVTRLVADLRVDDRFRVQERQYTRQYAALYDQRAVAIRPTLEAAARKLWPDTPYIENVLDIPPKEPCYVIGTVYAEMPLKPNVLDEISEERYLVKPPPRPKYVSDMDKYELEDASGRVALVGERVTKEVLVTGIVIAVCGIEQDGGELLVHDICYPSLAPQAPLPVCKEDAYVVLMSGLEFGLKHMIPTAPQLLIDWLTGQIGGPVDHERAARVVHVIIAGNSLSTGPAASATSAIASAEDDKTTLKKQGSDTPAMPVEPLLQLDQLLSELCESLSVDLMPGEHDPASHSLPQQPLYRALLPYSATMSTFRPVTNPYGISVNGVHFLGTSGQTLDDIFKYVRSEDRLQLLEQTLRWRHLAPTAPDTLACMPFNELDPFVIEHTPHVYFVGNQPGLGTRLYRDKDGQVVRLVLLPKFASSATAVLVNLRTLDVWPLSATAQLGP